MKKVLIISAIVAASLLLLAGVILFILWRASQFVPEFYTQVLNAEPAEQRQASDRMIQKSTLLAGDVRKPGRWEALFTEQEVNGWLAVDRKENHPAALPPGITDPRIVIQPGSLQMACRAKPGSVETVLSLTLEAYLAEPGVLAIRVRSVRAGALPLPMAKVLDQIGELGNRQGFMIEWQQAEGDPVALVHIDPVIKGNKLVVIDTVELTEHEIYVSGTTEEVSKSDDQTKEPSTEQGSN